MSMSESMDEEHIKSNQVLQLGFSNLPRIVDLENAFQDIVTILIEAKLASSLVWNVSIAFLFTLEFFSNFAF